MQSRNQREGRYAGKWKGLHFRTKAKWRWFAPPNLGFAKEAWRKRDARIKRILDMLIQRDIRECAQATIDKIIAG